MHHERSGKLVLENRVIREIAKDLMKHILEDTSSAGAEAK